ncbi:MAG: T9SS type A sorting domain-containing protein, partial [Flavobacteriaceae bacterium]|nr:T9SS type A sorting domain-containing protein [Flavobacteriaceae bacterium]
TNEVAIYDISGRLIKSFKGTFIENKDFDISNLKSSIYLVRITSDEGSITRKVIKK